MDAEQNIINNLNKVFIPHRSVIEMEALISVYLAEFNYDKIKAIPESRLSSQELIEILDIQENQAYMDIIERFINITVHKIKPIAMYAREHHDVSRMGNIVAHTKTRGALYLALHRLKTKFLFIKSYLDIFKKNNFQLPEQDAGLRLNSALYEDFYDRNKKELQEMVPTKHASNRVKNLMDLKDRIVGEQIIDMATFESPSKEDIQINFIMRGIKASIFVSKMMFAKIDILNPFQEESEMEMDIEDMMISNDFIPRFIPVMSKYFAENNIKHLEEHYEIFEFLMNKVLDGINHALEIASGGQINIGRDSFLYNTRGALGTFHVK